MKYRKLCFNLEYDGHERHIEIDNLEELKQFYNMKEAIIMAIASLQVIRDKYIIKKEELTVIINNLRGVLNEETKEN